MIRISLSEQSPTSNEVLASHEFHCCTEIRHRDDSDLHVAHPKSS